jgi:hypothetical protein
MIGRGDRYDAAEDEARKSPAGFSGGLEQRFSRNR